MQRCFCMMCDATVKMGAANFRLDLSGMKIGAHVRNHVGGRIKHLLPRKVKLEVEIGFFSQINAFEVSSLIQHRMQEIATVC